LPLSTAEVADALSLHANTVRPHLERMRDVGLLVVDTGSRGGVGRPQHRYSLAPDAPALGLEPSAFPMLASMLLDVATSAGLEGSDVIDAGRAQGRVAAASWLQLDAVVALCGDQERLGFDPTSVDDDQVTVVAFAHCPFRPLADANPDLVCSLHQGLVEGFIAQFHDCAVQQFHPLVDRTPCQVELVGR
jgi:predicted ArsR family transcriptional regulator